MVASHPIRSESILAVADGIFFDDFFYHAFQVTKVKSLVLANVFMGTKSRSPGFLYRLPGK